MTRADRRAFLRNSCGALLTLPAVSGALTRLAAQSASQSKPASVPAALARRIAISTVSFRERFKSSRGNQPNPYGEDLTLETSPKFIAENFGIHNVEMWSMHFDDQSLAYCEKVRGAAEKAGAKIVNIPLDGEYDLSSPDDTERKRSIDFVKGWVDRSKAAGCPRLRPNPQSFTKTSEKTTLATTIDSYKQITDYAKKAGVKILTKNFVGATLNIDTLIELIQGVNDPDCRLMLDWYNTRFNSMDARLAAFRKAFPLMEIETAKGAHFDANYKMTDYDPAPIIRATEASGFRGIYSIELYAAENPPADSVRATHTVLNALVANMRG